MVSCIRFPQSGGGGKELILEKKKGANSFFFTEKSYLNFLKTPIFGQEIIILEKSDCQVFAGLRYPQKPHRPVFMNVDDLHFWISRRRGQAASFPGSQYFVTH